MTRQPFSVAPAGPRKGFWKEEECMFSDGSPLAVLYLSSSHWQGASHRPNSASSLGLGPGPPLTLHGPWVSLYHTNPGHTRYPEFLDLIHLTQHNAGAGARADVCVQNPKWVCMPTRTLSLCSPLSPPRVLP